MHKKDIIDVANKLYAQYGTIDPYSICDNLGYVVLKDYNMPDKLNGTTKEVLRIKFIRVNGNKSYESQTQACLHELGHNILKHDDNILFLQSHTLHVTSKEENEANQFMIYMLLAQYTPMELYGLTKEQILDMIGVDKKYIYLL